MRHHQEAVALRQANGDMPVFFLRVVRVRDSGAECIPKDRRGFTERDLVPADTLCFLFRVPLKFHLGSVASLSSFANLAIAL